MNAVLKALALIVAAVVVALALTFVWLGSRGLSAKVEPGVRFTGTPAWSHESDESKWHLVHFIRELPRLTRAQLEKMEGLNPRAAGDSDDAVERPRRRSTRVH